MSSRCATPSASNESPISVSHTTNSNDIEGTEGQSHGEEDDDDMDFDYTTDDGEDIEVIHGVSHPEEDDDSSDSNEDVQGEFQDTDDESAELETLMGEQQARQELGNMIVTPALLEHSGASILLRHAPPIAPRISVPRNQMMQFFGHAGLRNLFTHHLGAASENSAADVDDEDTEDGADRSGARRRRKTEDLEKRFPSVPSEQGRELMRSGTFGSNEYFQDIRRGRKARLASRLMYRELGVDRCQASKTNEMISQDLLPSSNADMIIHYNSRCYSGQFSDDGNFFFSCAQDFKVRMYDTSNPYKWKYYKTVDYPSGQWTITDASLSPDNKFLAYSSIQSVVCMASTDPGQTGEPWRLDFSDLAQPSQLPLRSRHFGIWSIRFSGDGREIVAGASDRSVYVYDIESRKSVLRIPNHMDDVNAVCYGDKSSPHILYSGSDDTVIRVWDRRSMGSKVPAGVFMGHNEGLTYVDSKGDGRYVLSNGKDQMMKLWDLRKMISLEHIPKLDPARLNTGFDYRFMKYSEAEYQPHPHDCSVVTFRGHRVLKTLIRCHFSPPGSTNSRYVYSGSEDGKVYIYNLDATLAGTVDVNMATHRSRPKVLSPYYHSYELQNRWKTCVRDASWHPNAPVIAATSWNGWGMSTGTCTTHSWNDGAAEDEGEPRMGLRVDQRLEKMEDISEMPRRGRY